MGVTCINAGKRRIKLTDLMAKEFQEELMQGENMVFCHQCQQKTNSTKQIKLLKYPHYLNVTLKMFDATGQKLPKLISVPFHLNLINSGIANTNYMLVSFIIHSGVMSDQGHYTQIGRSVSDTKKAWRLKNSSSNWSEYGDWTYSNDEIKRSVKMQKIKNVLGLGRVSSSFECAYNLTFLRMEDIHGIAIPQMPNVPLYPNEPEYENVTIEDWNNENDDNNYHYEYYNDYDYDFVEKNKSDVNKSQINTNDQSSYVTLNMDNAVSVTGNYNYNNHTATRSNDNDCNILTIMTKDCDQKEMEMDYKEGDNDIDMVQSSMLNLPKL